MGENKCVIFSIFFLTFLHISYGNGCQMEGVSIWALPIAANILDTFRGTVISRNIQDITGIPNINYGEATIAGPYFDIELIDSHFVIRTNNNFENYEEVEVSELISVTVDFSCTVGTANLIFLITITDTNNNAPQFIPTDEFEYIVTPPLPPGFLITGCLDDITVRDIDLTTSRIDFAIEGNPDFEIEYVPSNPPVAKEFKAQLRTTTFIRSLREPITLRITATDVDSTADPPLTTNATVRILADTQFELPEEPVFSQPFYFANYTYNHQFISFESISLKQGFDETVRFSVEGEYSNYFATQPNGNQVSLVVSEPLPTDVWVETQIYLIVRADREFTSGDSATVIVKLPAARELDFEESTYRGSIENDSISLQTILLLDGYEDDVSFGLSGEYSDYFTATNIENQVTINLSTPLNDTVIRENSVIMLTLTASGLNAITTTTSILLDIIKEDTTTPVFTQNIYYGTYFEPSNIEIEAINLAQGYDNRVTFRLDGAHSQYFNISNTGNNAVISLRSPIPEDVIFNEKVLLFNVFADKALTVGANAAVAIRFPTDFTERVPVLGFDRFTYVGSIENNQANVPAITLSEGYTSEVQFTLHGDLKDFFSLTRVGATVTVVLQSAIPDESIPDNRIILLEIQATAPQAVPTHATIVMKHVMDNEVDQIVELIFAQTFYTGSYTAAAGLSFDTPISLTAGYDTSVEFGLEGDDAQWFGLVRNQNSVTVVLTSAIPAAVLANNQQLVFVITALRPGSTTTRATVIISLNDVITEGSPFLGFDRVTYVGSIENNQANVPAITLSEGYTSEVQFTLHGDLKDFFSLTRVGATVTVVLQSAIPDESIPDNRIILLEIQATAPQAVPTQATIVMKHVLDNDVDQIVELIFAQTFYTGSYTAATGLSFYTPISLTAGYDTSVAFGLEGDDAQWFGLVRNQNSVTVVLTSAIPAAVLANNQQLVFVITALRPGSTTTRATVIISLNDVITEGSPFLGFDRVTYVGSIENNQAKVPAITLSEGYTSEVQFMLHGDLKDFFSLTRVGATVTVVLQSAIPDESIPDNRIILLEIQATAPQAVPTQATIVMKHVLDNDVDQIVELIFAQTFYTGSYTAATGLSFYTPISLTAGYDTSVEFGLEGDDAQWFGLVRNQNSVTVVLTSAIPAAVLANNQQLVFVVTALRPGSTTTRATVVISLNDVITEGSPFLGFDRVTYVGSIENNQANVPAITLSEGYTSEVQFTLHGDLKDFFSLTRVGATVTVVLQSAIPDESIPDNRIILLEIQATAPQAVPTQATIVMKHVLDNDVDQIVELIFAQTFYTGSYTAATGLSFDTPISLTAGYDTSVEFGLEGDDAQWFGLVRNQNSVTVVLTSAIPAAVLANNQQLVFVITALRSGSTTTRATVIISLNDVITEGSPFLGFDRVTYVGSIENNQANVPAITLSEGYTSEVQFTLHGDLKDFFSLTRVGATVTVVLQSAIPDESIPDNRIILLEIQATAPQAVPTQATIVMKHVLDNDVDQIVELIFAQTFYTGSYTAATGLSFYTPISLTAGYDTSVEFGLEGDDAQWFGLVRNQNSVTVVLTSAIPAAVLANNQQLVFVITALRPGSTTTRATVIISLNDVITEGSPFLGFDRVTYVGSIENNQANVPAIILSEGYTSEVQFTLHGDLKDFFSLTRVGATVTVVLQSAIPDESIPDNRIILLEIQATAPQAVPTQATIVMKHVLDNDVDQIVELIFAQTFYTGSYTAATGLSFYTPISLTAGYDTSVEFGLEGDDAQWFGLVRNQNSVTVVLTSAIPAAVLANNQQLVFVVTALRPGSTTTRATVVISLNDVITEGSPFLGFDRVTYVGSIENNQANVPAITLSEGYTSEVQFTLHGDLKDFFSLTRVGATVTVVLQSAIPDESIPDNRIILLEIQATAPQAVPTQATIVMKHVLDNDVDQIVELIFAQTFYTGSYTAATGLSFDTPISLTAGYDTSVEFGLEGDDAQWFGLVRNQNSVTVVLTSAIPAAVLANNQQLVFVITALRSGSTTTRATVIISLNDVITEGSPFLGFDRVTYVGSIENNQANVPAITLSEGYTSEVQFTLHGDLKDFFSLTRVGATVTVVLQSAIPDESIPDNRIILLEIQATAPQAVPTQATIVMKHVLDNDVDQIVELIFAQTFYTGSYTAATGLSFYTPISLTAGYDTSVEFGLEGDDAQWFGLVRNQNSVTVVLTSAIPAAVLANNQQLVFVITALRPGSTTTRATVIISLNDVITEGSPFLGFDRVTYVGSIENNQANVPAIILSEGYTSEVQFTLHGDLKDFFSLTRVGATVTVILQSAIPDESIPDNRIILLEIQATAPQAVPTQATIVMKHVLDNDVDQIIELIFAQTFYTGSYTAATGLSFYTPISLTAGYDTSVEFGLEGDDAQWFGLVRNQNSVTVVLTSAIPAAVLANNQQLVFVVTALRPGSTTTRATVVISLNDVITEGSPFLGFDRVTYVGSIENNQANVPAITLSEGYTSEVQFTLHGDLKDFFSLTRVGATVTVVLQSAIPDESIPDNRIILLEIQATAPQAVPTQATIVMKHVLDNDVDQIIELIFAQTFYTGSYTAATGLSFYTPISLTAGYDTSVEFGLEGDDAQWFGLVRNQNSVTVVLTSAIPAAVLANNQQLVFVITALRPGSTTTRATVIISLNDVITEGSPFLGFDRVTYVGSIENNQANVPAITLSEGYTSEVQFTLHGDLKDFFSLTRVGATVTVVLQSAIPDESIPDNRIILLEIQATAPQAVPTQATIVMKHVLDNDVDQIGELIFAQTFYTGSYTAATGLSFYTPISLTAGYDTSVEFGLEGDDAQWFGLVRNQNSVTVVLTSAIPAVVLANNQQLVFVITALRPGSTTTRATVIISLNDVITEGSPFLGFDRVTYVGSIENNQANVPAITLSEGYTSEVQFTLHGDLKDFFSLTRVGATVTVVLQSAIPDESIPDNRIILLEIQATAPQAVPTQATIVMKHVLDNDVDQIVELIFAQTFYTGSYTAATGLSFDTPISLTAGYDTSVEFGLEGDDAQWFGLVRNQNSVTVVLTSAIPAAVLANNQQLVFVITALIPGSTTTRATVIISLNDVITEGSPFLGFDRVTYVGSIENNLANVPAITLSEGYTSEVQFTLHGDLKDFFSLTRVGATVTVVLQSAIPDESIPDNRIILLEIQATAPQAVPTQATIVMKHVLDNDVDQIVELIFAQTFYTGSYTAATGLSFDTPISLTAGYDTSVEFGLEGDDAQWFGLVRNQNSVTVVLTSAIPAVVLANNQQLVFVVTAQRPGSATARAIVVISVNDESQAGSDVAFEKVLYEGIIQNNIVNHETVTVFGYTGSTIVLHGQYSTLFEAELSNTGVVTVNRLGSLTLPIDISHVALELHAGPASSVLVLNVLHTDAPILPAVTFSSESYAIRTETTQTGLVGQVQALANNGEAVTYSLLLDNTHLQERLSVNSEGELYLSAPANNESYTFQVVATTVFTQATGTATVHLTVEDTAVCGADHVMSPLIIIDVDEEEEHKDLLNGTQFEGCHYILNNRWPMDHNWVYVDKDGLHTNIIDREHGSIAYMPVSQIQVEIILQCEEDTTRANKFHWYPYPMASRSLGPYDYGDSSWILTETIVFNSRRSMVNIIVSDINDNAPVFEDYTGFPVPVGYPKPDLVDIVMPRSLAELKANDRDIGENAALLYWSSHPEIAVAPFTGFVHVRDGHNLDDNMLLTVNATDRYGQGLTGSINLVVKLLDWSNIAVVTVKDAFLNDESDVLYYLTQAAGYEVKILKSVVISDEVEVEHVTRVRSEIVRSEGATLQLYAYAIYPVSGNLVTVDELAQKLSNPDAITQIPINLAGLVSLEDHLEGQLIWGRNTGLLVSTIVLSVLLFILIVLIAVWLFLRWRKNRDYDEFSDENSLASRNESIERLPKPEIVTNPRLNIAELKKSERRLQEMLDAPVQEITAEPPTSSRNDAILDIPIPETTAPIVIQSIDKLKTADGESSDDEFGELKMPKRKSVVTFNENVEKIIHVEDNELEDDVEDVSEDPDYEVYKL